MRPWLLYYFLFVATTSLIVKECSAILCYSCSYTRSADPSLTYECVDQPQNVTTGSPTIDCPTFCNTQRRYQVGTGLTSFSRSCAAPSSAKMEECKSDVHGSTCFTSCDSSDLCNGGTGIPPGYNEKGEKVPADNSMRVNSKFLIILVVTISRGVF